LPAAGDPDPVVVLAIPIAVDPNGVAVWPRDAALVSCPRGRVFRDADVERSQIRVNLRDGRHGDKRRQRGQHDRFQHATVHVMLLGALPAWPHSRRWGYGPTGGLGLVVLILVVLLLTGRL